MANDDSVVRGAQRYAMCDYLEPSTALNSRNGNSLHLPENAVVQKFQGRAMLTSWQQNPSELRHTDQKRQNRLCPLLLLPPL